MKIVKTRKHWRLHRAGYPVAIRFNSYSQSSGLVKIKKWLTERYGAGQLMLEYGADDEFQWASQMVRPKRWNQPYTYFVGLRHEADVSTMLLSLGDQL